jgi:hypothetical protein
MLPATAAEQVTVAANRTGVRVIENATSVTILSAQHLGAHNGGTGLVGDDSGDLAKRRHLALQGHGQREAKPTRQQASKSQERQSE